MKAKDTAMSGKARHELLDGFKTSAVCGDIIAEAQAEISFKMGYEQALLDNHLPVVYKEWGINADS